MPETSSTPSPAAAASAATDPLAISSIAFLGPEGSFSHLVAGRRYGDSGIELAPCADIPGVFQHIREQAGSVGIVPIENSSGGIITPTVDCILEDSGAYQIIEEMALNVHLALIGRRDANVKRIISHFAPFHHCSEWLRRHYPEAEHVVESSTSRAMEIAATEPDVAAIGPRDSAARHDLEVLEFPIEAEVPNVTQFFAITRAGSVDIPPSNDAKTSLVVMLPDSSGSLCDFLTPFARAEVNLKRIESRPIRGRPNTYRFFVEVDGHTSESHVREALANAEAVSESIRNMGSYPAGTRYES